MLKFGSITEVDMTKGVARVHFSDADIVSSWLPIIIPAGKEDKFSIPIVINEQVSCLMDDNCEYGVILGAIYSQKVTPPGEASNTKLIIDIGATKLQLIVDRTNGNLSVKSSGTITVEGDNVVVKANEVEVEAANSAKVTTINAEITASASAKITSPTLTIESPVVSVSGALSAATISAGGFSGAGGAPMAVTADINVTGKVESTGDMKAGGKSLMTHIHTAPSGGGSTSTPV